MLKIGIIGCGKIAQVRHIPEYLANPETEIAGYFDFKLERAKELAEKFGGKAYATPEELFCDKTIDAVSICSANIAHAKNAVYALKSGKHVLCEKPMAINIEECEAMVSEAKTAGKKLMIDQNQRLVKTHQQAKKLISEGLSKQHLVTEALKLGALIPEILRGSLIKKVPQWVQWEI